MKKARCFGKLLPIACLTTGLTLLWDPEPYTIFNHQKAAGRVLTITSGCTTASVLPFRGPIGKLLERKKSCPETSSRWSAISAVVTVAKSGAGQGIY